LTSPLAKLLEIYIPVYIAVDVLHSRMIENVNLGGAPHDLNGMSLGQRKLRRILFESQIFNGRNKQVGVRVLRACSTGGGRDGKGLFQARYSGAKPNLHGSQSLGAFKNMGRVFGPDVLVLKAGILEKYSGGSKGGRT
jgi:hypothetical protein